MVGGGKICPRCGTHGSAEERFCPRCGTTLILPKPTVPGDTLSQLSRAGKRLLLILQLNVDGFRSLSGDSTSTGLGILLTIAASVVIVVSGNRVAEFTIPSIPVFDAFAEGARTLLKNYLALAVLLPWAYGYVLPFVYAYIAKTFFYGSGDTMRLVRVMSCANVVWLLLFLTLVSPTITTFSIFLAISSVYFLCMTVAALEGVLNVPIPLGILTVLTPEMWGYLVYVIIIHW